MKYRIQMTRRARRGLKDLPTDVSRRIAKRIDALAEDPRLVSSRKLAGSLSPLRRFRVGDYRVGYEIDEQAGTVIIHAVGPRRGFYESLQRSH